MSADDDRVLWTFLVDDVLYVEAEERLPPPPQSPVFARETVRPTRVST